MIWTKEQAAALTAEHHAMLVANAGTGKTTTVVGKIRWLLGEDVGEDEEGNVIPRCPNPCELREIAAITFTEKAAYDLKRKLREGLAGRKDLLAQIDRAALGTIHSFCGQLLRENAVRLGIDASFRVLDEQEAEYRQSAIIRDIVVANISRDADLAEVFRTYGLKGTDFTDGCVGHVRSVMRDLRWHPDRYEGDSYTSDEPRDLKVWQRCRALIRAARMAREAWEKHELKEGVRDYDSLILDTRDLLVSADGAAALERIRGRYRILVIDEFQDTDGAQRDIAYAIARAFERPQLFLVGDPKQSIYRFRGADISVWNAVAGDLSAIAPPLPMTRNFRSDPVVVEAANAVSHHAFNIAARALETDFPDEVVQDSPLVAHKEAIVRASVEWLEPRGDDADECRANEGEHIASRIQRLVGEGYKHSDIAVLYRTRTGVEPYKAALRRAGIPLHDSSPAGLTDRQEIHDVLNYLRILHNRTDDLRAFALLRSPFIGLRDEVIARIRFSMQGATLLRQARRYLDEGEWYPAPEHAMIDDIERRALAEGLKLYDDARSLVDRVPLDELMTFLLDCSGYRNHLQLIEGSREALANLQAFVQLCETYRDLSLGAFLEMWDQRDPDDPGLPTAQMFSAKDDFVTFSTIHAAKGLEWPVVFLVDVGCSLNDRSANTYWTDPKHGAVLCPKKEEQGPVVETMRLRRAKQELAEQARVLYVGVTRAKEKLIITGEVSKNSFGEWLNVFDVDHVTAVPEYEVVQVADVKLGLLDTLVETTTEHAAIAVPKHRFLTSATELMTKAHNPEEWERKYIHGIEAPWFFARPSGSSGKVSAAAYGTLVHGVLERIREEAELAEILEETLSDLDSPELEAAFAAGTAYREALEAEISRVVTSEEWRWYVEGEHYRELPFIHLVGPEEWRVGAFDLYRPDGWIIDFKTHQIGADKVAAAAEDYDIQARVYKEAVKAIVGVDARMRLHFTAPNVAVEVS